MSSQIEIPVGKEKLIGELSIPFEAKGIVLFAHGSGSGRLSPRNQFVARSLRESKIATLLIDLLTIEEERIDQVTHALRFDISLLADRLILITKWLQNTIQTQEFPISYFGASTGAAAALIAAASLGESIISVVSRGGRPDLASTALPLVKSPTLLIIGGADHEVIKLNEDAYKKMNCEKKIEIVPNATHLFEEEGALEMVVELSSNWFLQHYRVKL